MSLHLQRLPNQDSLQCKPNAPVHESPVFWSIPSFTLTCAITWCSLLLGVKESVPLWMMLKFVMLALIFIINDEACGHMATCGTKSNSSMAYEAESSYGKNRIWPHGILRYQISSSFSKKDKNIIKSAVKHLGSGS